MSIAPPISPPALLLNDGSHRRWRWTVEDFERFSSEGQLPDDERFELIDGEVVRIMPPGPEHSFFVEEIAALLAEAIGNRPLHARQEKPARLGRYSEPQPDVLVVRGARRDYRFRNPDPADVLLAVEVAESSLEYDRGPKLAMYAESGVPEYWIINLPESRIEVHRRPTSEGYREVVGAVSGDELPVPGLGGTSLAARSLLGEPTA